MIPGIIGAGLIQGIGGFLTRQMGKSGVAAAESEYKRNPYVEDSSITDIYNRQLAATNASPIESAAGRIGQRKIDRQFLTLLKSGKSTPEQAMRMAGEAQSNLIGNLAAQKRAERSLLSQAAQMKMGEKMKAYKYNVLDPINRRYGLSAQQMAEGGAMASSGARNIISGLSALNATTGKRGGDASTGSSTGR